jgi:hypothetical protein
MAATDLEAALHDKAEPAQLQALQRQFDAVLTPFVERLRSALGTEAPPVPVPDADAVATDSDPALRSKVIGQMLRHLANLDAAASQCLETHRGLFAALLPGDAFRLFEQRVQDYAFAEAQAQLLQAAMAVGR